MISNCGHDEVGKYRGGQAGDQTGHEWEIIPWYPRPWNVVLRYPDRAVGQKIADLARAAAKNNNIGYDQNQRYSYWYALKAVGYDPSKITELCEADCSGGVAANVKAAGFLLGLPKLQKVSIYMYTGNERSALKEAGFNVLTDPKYLNSDQYLLPGDILLYEGHHTATNLDKGAKAGEVATSATLPRWIEYGGSWVYREAPNKNAHGFRTINHHRYYFDGSGIMQKGWFQVEGDWYYGQPSGGLEGALYVSDAEGRQTILYID